MIRTKTLNFRKWLESLGVLTEYVRGYLAGDLVHPYATVPETCPMTWLNWQHPDIAHIVPEGSVSGETWEEIELSWDNLCQNGSFGEVVMGMPLTDKLGMTLLMAELEASDGEA